MAGIGKDSLMRPFNWKTTGLGSLAGLLALASLFVSDPAISDKMLALALALGGGGLVAAKDHDK